LLVGNFDISTVGVKEEPEPCNCEIKILQIKPNPITNNSNMSITIYMPKEDEVDFSIYDATGRLVNDLKDFDHKYKYGPNSIDIDLTGKNLQTGTYYLTVYSGGKRDTKMFTIVR
jgi:hypothetical protein